MASGLFPMALLAPVADAAASAVTGAPQHLHLALWHGLGPAALWMSLAAVGLGLLLSTAIRSQFNAAQAALNAAFLPVMMLSGFVYEIGSMPRPVQVIASILPGRYFVTILQTLFQSDYAGQLYWLNAMALSLIAAIFLGLTALKTKRTLD